MELKTCTKCGIAKPFEEFHKHAQTRDKRVPKCKACAKAYAAQWNRDTADERKAFRQRNKDVLRERQQKYYLDNRDAIRAKNSAREKLDREGARKRLEKWRSLNAEKMEAFRAAWKAANPHKLNADAAKRRAARRRAVPIWADLAAIESIYAQAQAASRLTGIEHHVDHIVPLISDIVCGLHWEANLRVLPGAENISKSNRYWPDMP